MSSMKVDGKPVYRFDVDMDTKQPILEPLGRLFLAGNKHVRMMLSPEGMVLLVPHEAIGKGVLVSKDMTDLVMGIPNNE
jgi:hypothetical protein